jgi:hypothetical protein
MREWRVIRGRQDRLYPLCSADATNSRSVEPLGVRQQDDRAEAKCEGLGHHA